MTNCATLTHKDAFSNAKLLEKLDSLPKKNVYGFGVNGKRFTIVKMDDNFFARIWFSILKFLKFIKVDSNSINQLKQYTFDHLKCNDYKEWAKTHCKISKVGIKNLLEENKQLKERVKEGKCQHTEIDKEKSTLQNEIETQRATIKNLQLQLVQSQSHLAEANADKTEKDLTIEEQLRRIEGLSGEVAALKKDLDKEKKQINHYKGRYKHYKNLSKDVKKDEKQAQSVQETEHVSNEIKRPEVVDKKSLKRHKKSEK